MSAHDPIAVFRFSKLRIAAQLRHLVVAILLLLAASAHAQVPDTLLHTFIPTPKIPQAGARLGFCVAVEGTYTVLGAPFDDSTGFDSGVVKIFNSTTGALHLVLPNPSPVTDYNFGYSVAICETHVVVGVTNGGVRDERPGVAYVYDLAGATPSVPVVKLENPLRTDDGAFGCAVAISGSRVVVGALGNPVGGRDAVGTAYVYDLRSASPTVPVAVLNNPEPQEDDKFGEAVAIDGTRVVVGTPNKQFGAQRMGDVDVYDLAGATPTVPVITFRNPFGLVNDAFGASVSVSGTRILASGFSYDTHGHIVSSAFIYDLTSATPSTPVLTLQGPSMSTGSAVIFGTTVVLGDRFDATGAQQSGSAFVYDLSSTTPTSPVTILSNPSPAAGDHFGWAVATNGTRILVSAPDDDTGADDAGSAYVYELASATPSVPVCNLNNPGAATLDHFGSSVAVSGTLMVVGVPYDDFGAEKAGSVYVYDLSGATPSVPVALLHNPTPKFGEQFGFSVAVDGARIVVGTPYDSATIKRRGNAYVYDLNSATPTVPLLKLPNPGVGLLGQFAWSVAISGTRVLIGGPDENVGSSQEGLSAGVAYVFDIGSVTPTVPVVTLPDPILRGRALFGYTVSICDTNIVIGAPSDDGGEGSVYVYDLTSGTPAVPVGALQNPNPLISDSFGFSVAISGMRVAVGTPFCDSGAPDAGSVYVYDFNTGRPRKPAFTINNPTPAPGDRFGYAVAISGTRVLTGAYNDSTGAMHAGSAYVYDLSNIQPTLPVATLNNPHPSISDVFGYAVAIDGLTVAIGTPLDDTVKLDRGAVYVYCLNPNAAPPTPADGLLASWKLTRFGTTTGHGPFEDDDRDGLNNLLEEAFNTDPLKPDLAAAPSVVNEGGYLTITIAKRAGVTYEVQSAATPDEAAFSAATTTVLVNDATLKVRDNFPIGTPPSRFLRVKVTAAP
jgi:hypothetical protein